MGLCRECRFLIAVTSGQVAHLPQLYRLAANTDELLLATSLVRQKSVYIDSLCNEDL
jgi:hypothetical protein